MPSPFPHEYKALADSMGISLYQRFTPEEAALFLRCPVQDVKSMVKRQLINFIRITDKQVEFFGYQLLEYLMNSVSNNPVNRQSENGQSGDRTLSTKQVQDVSGLSRSTIWRLENKQQFPSRVSLSAGRVGWRASDVDDWLASR